jgi:4-diphosphocytidyl-2-C-methyl-D-erythritol kinase
LERGVLPTHPQVLQLKQLFAEQPGVFGTMMSGSGPAVFALVESQPQAEVIKENIAKAIPDPDLELFITRTISSGISLIS